MESSNLTKQVKAARGSFDDFFGVGGGYFYTIQTLGLVYNHARLLFWRTSGFFVRVVPMLPNRLI